MYLKPFCFMQSARIASTWRRLSCGSAVVDAFPVAGAADGAASAPQPVSTASARATAGMVVRTRDTG